MMFKRRICMVLLSIFLLTAILPMPAQAAGVPEAVMNSREAVVLIVAAAEDGYYMGSGFALESDQDNTVIATNLHVVGNGSSVSVYISQDNYVNGTVLATSEKDMCLISIPGNIDLPKTKIRTDDVTVGEAVYAVGFPGLTSEISTFVPTMASDSTITDGIISSLHDTDSGYGVQLASIQHTANIGSGNSGGPLFDVNGNVVGINTWGAALGGAEASLAIHAQELKSLAAQNGIALTEGKAASETEHPVATEAVGETELAPNIEEIASVQEAAPAPAMAGWVWGVIAVVVIGAAAVVVILTKKNGKADKKPEVVGRKETDKTTDEVFIKKSSGGSKMTGKFTAPEIKQNKSAPDTSVKMKKHFSDMDEI